MVTLKWQEVELGTTYEAKWCISLVLATNGLRNVNLSRQLLDKSGFDQNERT